MIDKDPTSWSLATWWLASGMALAGGLINWYFKVKKGSTRVFNIVELIGELFISFIVGLGSFMVSSGLGYPEGVSAGIAGITGHLATRLLFFAEQAIEAKALAYIKKLKK